MMTQTPAPESFLLKYRMGFRIIQTLPPFPVPTTYAVMGEYGCPFAATSVLLAAAQMDPMGAMCGTSIFNLSIPESTVTDEGDFEKLVILVETYFRSGGLHLQLNHVSRETLIDAQKHPERYPDLRVRVSGFSGYFVRFKKTIQDEIIARTITTVR